MNIRNELLKGHSKAITAKIVDFIGNNPDRFATLVSIFLQGPYRITQRAAWPLTYCAEQDPALIKPHLKKILDHLGKPGIHDAVKRNTIRLLQFIEIPKRYHGQVANICFQFLQNKKEAVAIRVFSMTVLGCIATHNPGLKNELFMLIEDQLPYASPAFRARAKKILKKFS
jgi:hypothetical protein